MTEWQQPFDAEKFRASMEEASLADEVAGAKS